MHPQLLREIAAIHDAEAHEFAARRHALRAAYHAPARRLLHRRRAQASTRTVQGPRLHAGAWHS